MPKKFFPTKPKPLPDGEMEFEETPNTTRELKEVPEGTRVYAEPPEDIPDFEDVPAETLQSVETPQELEKIKSVPAESPQIEEVPAESPQLEELPEESPLKEEMPSDLNEENVVVVNGKKFEIKPTKLKYFRNKAASAYGIVKAVPLHELLTYDKGVLDPKRTADQLLYDFLVAAFDNLEFVKENYDEMDADTVEQVCKIFGRLNHIDEKQEAARKNREAQAKP